MIQLTRVSKIYETRQGNVVALDSVDLSLERGASPLSAVPAGAEINPASDRRNAASCVRTGVCTGSDLYALSHAGELNSGETHRLYLPDVSSDPLSQCAENILLSNSDPVQINTSHAD